MDPNQPLAPQPQPQSPQQIQPQQVNQPAGQPIQPVPQPQPTQQPAVTPQSYDPLTEPAAAPTQQAHATGGTTMVFSSNPFRSIGKGIGDLLHFNPQSGLTITLMYLFVAAPYFLGVTLTLLLGNPFIGLIAIVVTVILAILIGFRVYVGSIYLYSKSNAKEEVTAKKAFNEGASSHLASVFLGSIFSVILIVIGLILFIVPGIILLARLSLMPFAIVEEDLGPVKAIRRSLQLTKGHTMEMLGVMVVGGFVSGNGLLSPVTSAAGYANRYYELKSFEAAGQPTGKKSSVNTLVVVLAVLFGLGYAAFFITVSTLDLNSNSSSNELFIDLDDSNDNFFDNNSLVN